MSQTAAASPKCSTGVGNLVLPTPLSKILSSLPSTTKYKRSKKAITKKKPATLAHKLKTCQKIIYGIDMSLNNPGLTMLHPVQKMIHLYFFRNRIKETSFAQHKINQPDSPFHTWTLQVYCIEHPPEKHTVIHRCEKYLQKLSVLLSLIGSNESERKVVGIEHYAFQAKTTQAYTQLMELGGCLRMGLYLQNHIVHEFAPSAIKKHFSGSGRASKDEMYQAFSKIGPNLFTLLGLDQIKYKHVPHPIEDMVDAFAVACTTVLLTC